MPLSDLQASLKDAIFHYAGQSGLDAYTKRSSRPNMPRIEQADGSPDLGAIMDVMLDLFPEDTATAIMTQAIRRLNEDRKRSGNEQAGPARDIQSILHDSILKKSGPEGLKTFARTVNAQRMARVTKADGTPDLYLLMNILLDVFPEDMASVIMDDTLATHESGITAPAIHAETKTVRMPPAEAAPRPKPTHEEVKSKLAMYVNADVSEVSDLINEARRIRIAMGKMEAKAVAQQPAPQAAPEPSQAPKPEPRPAPRTMRPLAADELDKEIHAFLDGQKAHTSVDIIDFIRYLKDKGYNFQENSVLEKVYLKIEERKAKVRAGIVSEIGKFLEERPWPSEEDVSGFIEKLKCGGLAYDDAEIKRMIRIEMFRKS